MIEEIFIILSFIVGIIVVIQLWKDNHKASSLWLLVTIIDLTLIKLIYL